MQIYNIVAEREIFHKKIFIKKFNLFINVYKDII